MTIALAENSIQLVPDGTLLFHIGLIILMVFVLNATLFGPVNRILEERERRTSGRSDEAQEILGRVETNVAQYERTLRDARAEGYGLLEQQRAEAMGRRQEQLNSLKSELDHSVEEQKNSVQTQSEEARTTLEIDARQHAAEIRNQILHRQAAL